MSVSYRNQSPQKATVLHDTSTEAISEPSSPSPDSSFGDGPGASAYLRAEKTLQELASQLSGLGVNQDDVECVEGCSMAEKLSLSAEVGAALLQRCEAQEKKHEYEMKRLQRQVLNRDVSRFIAVSRASQTANVASNINNTFQPLVIDPPLIAQVLSQQKSLAEKDHRVQSLERANNNHLTRYAELNRRHEALEKRYTQSIHDHTLTQQSLSHVRSELASQRTRMHRQSISLAMSAGASNPMIDSGGWQDKLAEVEARLEAVRDEKQAADVAKRDCDKRCRRLEGRVEELEQQLTVARAELEETKEARRSDARVLLNNAKERLDVLHQELSATLRADDPEQTPEYQIAMENLVASNTMLKHDASELSHLLAESRDEVRVLRDEVEELRSFAAGLGRVSPAMLSHPHLAAEIMSASIPSSSSSGTSRPSSAAHVRTESSPMVSSGTFTTADRRQWTQYQQQQHQKRMSVSSSRFGSVIDYAHARKSSLAPSFASSSTTDGVTSPGLGYGSIGEYGGQLLRDQSAMSPNSDIPVSGRESPRLGFRTSTSGGIGYVLNGVPKTKRPGINRSISERPNRASGQWAIRGVDTINEQPLSDHADGHTTDEPLSPASEYFRAADISRKRRSLMLARHSSVSPHGSTDYNVSVSGTTMVEGMSEVTSPAEMASANGLPRIDTAGPKQSPAKKHNRRTLLLLTKNKGIQTRAELDRQAVTGNDGPAELSIELPLSANTADMPLLSGYDPGSLASAHAKGTSLRSALTSPNPDDRSESSSLHVPASGPTGGGHILAIVDHLAKLLNRLRAADLPTLNKRLRKQHLPGDVSHLSRSTLQTLSKEIGDLKSHNAYFRPLLDINSSASIQRREWNALLKLLRDLFDELVDMQALINDVTLNPKLAKRLQRDAYKEDDELGADPSGTATAGTGGLGWIANPITRLFVTPAAASPEDEHSQNGGTTSRTDRTRLKPDMPPGRAAPKQAAVASATTTHVEVGFGGVGMPTRGRVVPASSSSSVPQVDAAAAESDVPDMNGQVISQSRTVSAASGSSTISRSDAADGSTGADSLMPPPPTLRRAKSRANRNELLGIFAGAQSAGRSGAPDTVRLGKQGLRAQSSQYFDNAESAVGSAHTGTVRQSDRTIRARPTRMSQGVEAVLDPQVSSRPGMVGVNAAASGRDGRDGLAEVYGDNAVVEEEEPSFQPLLYRTLRPRGNSDSSIRSTFISQKMADDALPQRDLGVGTGAPTARQGGYGYGGLLAGLRGKLWSTAVPAPTAPKEATEASAARAAPAASVDTPVSNPANPALTAPSMSRSVSTGTSPAPPSSSATKAVPIARSVSSTGSGSASAASPRSHGQSPSQSKNGILGYIASSLGGDALLDPESDGHGQFGGGRSPGRMGRAEEEDMMRAALRQGSGVARRHQRWE